VILDGWVEEIQKFVPTKQACPCCSSLTGLQYKRHVHEGTLKVSKFHRQGKLNDLIILLNYDVVLTTYATVLSEFSKDNSVLYRIEWFRVVLDEGTFSCKDTNQAHAPMIRRTTFLKKSNTNLQKPTSSDATPPNNSARHPPYQPNSAGA
jgi:SNF2 family DNA or RNA helicase